jgi:hypothetical protein
VDSVLYDKCSLSYKDQVSSFADAAVELSTISARFISEQNEHITQLVLAVAATSIVNTALRRKLRIVESEYF